MKTRKEQAVRKAATEKQVVANGTRAAGKAQKTAAPAAKQARHGSKKVAILDLIGRNEGATVKELVAATDWLPHSIRGPVSNLVRKDGQKIEAIKGESGERAYHPAAGR